MERNKLYLESPDFEKLGFEQKSTGDDPRDFWHEIKLENKDNMDSVEAYLEYDAYCDFSLNIPELSQTIPLNFQSIDEIMTFINVFNRKYNHAFSGLIDMAKNE